MTERLEELKQYLPGLEAGMPKEFEKLAEIFRHEVFELYESEGTENWKNYLIPYMMNDAVEDYLVLKNSRLVGQYLTEKELKASGRGQYGDGETEVSAEVVREDKGYILIVRQGIGNVFTLHFQGIEECVKYYQYHRIGHFWIKGQEQWRQLVYQIGTIYDKYEYLGEQACNEEEMQLLRLMEFPPFRCWSPVSESLNDKYDATHAGIISMERIAHLAKDPAYEKWIHLYQKLPVRWIEKVLSRKLLSPKRAGLYQWICEKVKAGSEKYPERDYGEILNCEIRKKREKIHRTLQAKGFHGTYPEYQREGMQVIATEEHPFTLSMMEFDDFGFRVQFMVSECGKVQENKNCGFFRGKDRRGYILSEEELDRL